MAISLFGNKELSAAKKWCAEYAIDKHQQDIVLRAVQQGFSAKEAIEIGKEDYRCRAETVRRQNDCAWAQGAARTDRGR